MPTFNDIVTWDGTALRDAGTELIAASRGYEDVYDKLSGLTVDGLEGETAAAEAKARRVLADDAMDLWTALSYSDGDTSFRRESDGAGISLGGRSGGETVVSITTGCHRGCVFQDWPAGTENIPAHLRVTGRKRKLGFETWPAQETATPIPSPPPNWTAPAPSGAPE